MPQGHTVDTTVTRTLCIKSEVSDTPYFEYPCIIDRSIEITLVTLSLNNLQEVSPFSNKNTLICQI